MAVNDFKAFAIAVASNVLSQADYVTLLAALSNQGYVAGVASSAALNKTWRQSSVMAAALGQLINDVTGDDALDDGSVATLVASLTDAIEALSVGVSTSTATVATTGGSTVLSVVEYTAKFIEVTGVLVSNATLVFPTQAGDWFVINSTTGGSFTLTCKTAAGTGKTVARTKLEHVVCDEVNIVYAEALGNLARLDIGQGLEDDGAGNLRVDPADVSIRRAAAGISSASPIEPVAGARVLALVDSGSNFYLTASANFAAPLSSTLWNGYHVDVIVGAGTGVFTPDAADRVNGGALGAPYSLSVGQSGRFTTDGAGNWYTSNVTLPPGGYMPRYLTGNITVPAGTYSTNSAAGSFTVTIPAGPSDGDSVTIDDPFGQWGAFPVTIGRNGNTIMGLAADLVLNCPGRAIKLVYRLSDTTWRLA